MPFPLSDLSQAKLRPAVITEERSAMAAHAGG
jgi:hypothetical protein